MRHMYCTPSGSWRHNVARLSVTSSAYQPLLPCGVDQGNGDEERLRCEQGGLANVAMEHTCWAGHVSRLHLLGTCILRKGICTRHASHSRYVLTCLAIGGSVSSTRFGCLFGSG